MNTTNKDKVVLLSRKGIKELKKSILQLEHDRQKELQELRELDKSSIRESRLTRVEKLAYIDGIEAEIAEKRAVLASAKLLPKTKNCWQVAIGSVVDLIDKSGKIFRYKLVDSVEANPSEGKISTESPLGKSLLGKTIEDFIEWTNGNKTNQLRLVSIC